MIQPKFRKASSVDKRQRVGNALRPRLTLQMSVVWSYSMAPQASLSSSGGPPSQLPIPRVRAASASRSSHRRRQIDLDRIPPRAPTTGHRSPLLFMQHPGPSRCHSLACMWVGTVLGRAVGACVVGAGVGCGVVGVAVGDAELGRLVGLALAVGDPVGDVVGDPVGGLVGDPVGAGDVGEMDGPELGRVVGDPVLL